MHVRSGLRDPDGGPPVMHASPLRRERFVEAVRITVPVPGVPQELERLPDGRTTLVVRQLAGGGGDAWVMGPRTRALFKTATGVARAVSIDLGPGWAMALLGVPASELVDRHVALEALWGRRGAELEAELVATRDPAAIVERLARVLATPEPPALAMRAVEILSRDSARVEDVAARLGVSTRHLRRVFVEAVGIAPKEFARCMRLHRALRATGTDWGRIAVDVGYYDQAHLIADFRDLVGMTPGAYDRRAFARHAC